jgi:heat shock protein HtpX
VYEQIAANKRRTFFIIAAFIVLIVVVVEVINYFTGGGIIGLIIAFVIAIGSSVVAYYNSDKVALTMSRARPADPQQYARYHNLVEGLCIASGLPTGRNPQHSAIAVTTGLLDKMNRVELEGVLAHELSHVRNYDILVSTIAVTMVGVLALLSDFFLRFMIWGGRSDRRDSNDAGPIGALLAIFGIALLILSPIIAQLMQLALSRRRESLADVSGVQLTRYPPGLISALKKLQDDHTVLHTASKATAHLWIEEPLDTDNEHVGGRFNKLFLTHPPLEERIKALEEL